MVFSRLARGVALVATLVSAALPFSTAAQEADTGRALPDTVAYELSPLEVTGSIAPTAGPSVGSGIPASISVVEGDEIDRWESRILSEALASRPGVSLYDDLGSPYKLNLSYRGFNAGPTVGLPSGLSVFVDGIRQNEPAAQEVNFDVLPLEHVERVELLSGNGSLLGRNSLGGAVNLVTRQGGAVPRGEIEVSGGAFGAWSGQGVASGPLGEEWGYYVGGGYDSEDGWRQATAADRAHAFAQVTRAGADGGLRVQALWTDSRAETAGSLPVSIFRVDPEVNFTAGDFEAIDLQQISASGYLPVGGGRGSLTAYVRRSDAERFNVNQPPEDDVRSFTTNRTVGGLGDWRRRFSFAGRPLSVRLGFELAADRIDARIFEEERGGGVRMLTTDVESPSVESAGYLLADLELNRIRLSAGARFDHFRIPFEDILDPGADTVSYFSRWSPRGGIGVDVGSGVIVHGSVGSSFRPPALLELACADPEDACPLPFALGDDPPLEPVTTTSYEAGARWRGMGAELSLAVYRSEVENEIFFVPSRESIVEGFFKNLDETRREGVEVATEVRVGSGLRLRAGYAYTRATFQSAEEVFSARSDDDFATSPLAGANAVRPGDRLAMVPPDQLTVGGSYRTGVGVRVGLDARYVGERWLRGDEANETERLDSSFVTDGRVGYVLGAWEVEAVVFNVFDTDTAIFGTFNVNQGTGELERFLTPMNPRALTVVIRRSFGG